MSSPSLARVANSRRRAAFTLVEILIVVVIMAVLAATIIPSFSNSVDDAKANTAIFNLNSIRSQIEHYRAEHNGSLPTGTLAQLAGKTDVAGTISPTGAYGPYLRAIPDNPLTGSATVKAITNATPSGGDITGTGGWLYNATTGGVWIDHATYVTE